MTQPRYLAERLTPDFGFYLREGELLARVQSQWQHIEVFDNALFGRVMRIDGCFMTSERDEFFYHEPMVHLPAIAHPGPRSALVVGGGDGGAVEELLKHPSMERVVLAELDAEVIAMARAWLDGIHHGALDDPRVEIRLGDARALIGTCGERFDQIVLDLTDPFGPALDLYTVEFYQACREVLAPGGVLSLHLGSPIHLPQSMARIAASLQAAFPIVRPYLQYIPLYGTLWCMAVASDSTDPALLSSETVDARIAERGLGGLQLYNGATHQALLAQPNFVRDLLARPAQPIHRGGSLPEAMDPEDLPKIAVLPV
ncbi:MAG: polyamine aminopropyltransferase [Giesbergeria sp.]|jgi:spermidine synthase|nr:polyamine aminopropyltransferase [Giesbergeria sp.]MBP6160927.1 polyamine aminopropyltransferase [Giesbergeria sp.]MBP7083536.1 polyamine aminopropyltransferase [Giesbergeria sp.]MBP9782986.1 polyamine aminopropyltransferase [Giesbergeria sp.]MBP9896659.1 polyamine aminopropyltransferase [Giesbergeria sp.]